MLFAANHGPTTDAGKGLAGPIVDARSLLRQQKASRIQPNCSHHRIGNSNCRCEVDPAG